jgi:transmembrane sensor
MNTDKNTIADFLSQESFISYCNNTSEKDTAFWENFIQANPEKAPLVAEAVNSYFQLLSVLAAADLDEQVARLENSITLSQPVPVIQMDTAQKSKTKKRMFRISIAAAAALLIVTAGVLLINGYRNGNTENSLKVFTAANGERKNFQLPDGSFITLNAGSSIRIKENFGMATRDVFLNGEAFFDVKHNEKSPFIVHTATMDVKALGTAFNVKAYPNENTTETALIKGLVEVTLKQDNDYKMLLYPNQKIKWNNLSADVKTKRISLAKKLNEIKNNDSLRKTLVASGDGLIKEIAWKSNKLVFDNEEFDDIALLLERWYGARILFKDNNIRHYRFTGVFEKEELSTVLDFLQESKKFNYTVEQDEPVTTISLTE